jgi:thioredoxin-dependent peroxiredoxin
MRAHPEPLAKRKVNHVMNRNIAKLVAASALAFAAVSPAIAQLAEGARAPNFLTQAALAGKDFGFSLAAALAKGPVVLYFYPKAFTSGCTLEANAFAEAMPQFKAAGASVIGMSNDDIDTLKRFSREECRDAFPVGVASPKVIAAYDVAMGSSGLASRTSYVIGRDGKVVTVYSSGDYRGHVTKTLEAVRKLSK